MQTWVIIDELTVKAIIGVHAWERAVAQNITVSARLACTMQAAFMSDDIKDAINYQQVCLDIARICEQTQAKLVEHLGYQLVLFLFQNYPCSALVLTIKKPNAISKAAAVGIHLECTRADIEQLNAKS